MEDTTSPSLSEFKETAAGFRYLSLRESRDLFALQRTHPDRYPYLLESTSRGPNGRYDILFAWPQSSLVLHASGRLTRDSIDVDGSFLTQLEKDAEERLDLKTGKSLAEMTNLIKSMREEISAQISSHGSLVMKEAERDLRAKVAEILSPLATVTANLLPNASGTFTRK